MANGWLAEQIRPKSPKFLLSKIAARELQYIRAQDAEGQYECSLLELVPRLHPKSVSPNWLAPYAKVLERPFDDAVRTELVFAAPPQHGKALDIETPMLTLRGWVKAGEVSPGDRLVASDGSWTTVLAVHPQGEVPLFRVQFTNGKSNFGPTLRACAEHQWLVTQRYGGPSRIRTTEQLAGDLIEADGRNKWRIPIVSPLIREKQDLLIEPYVLGLWLGDGTSTAGAVTTADVQVLDAFVGAGYQRGFSTNRNTGAATTYGFLRLMQPLRELGVLGNKHIPRQYLDSSTEDRLALLQGLCDSDGWVAKNGSQQAYCSTNERLAEDFRFLVHSLGGTCTERVRPAAAKTAWEIWFRLPDGLSGFRLERKAERLNDCSARSEPRRFISSIEPDGVGQAVCFTVDAQDSLFCAGRELVLTHNTFLTLTGLVRLFQRYPGREHCYVTYNQVRADEVSSNLKMLAEAAGLNPQGPKYRLELAGGTAIKIIGIGSSLTGAPISGILVIDDPVKDREDAESARMRDRAWNWWTDVADVRVHPGGAVIVMATRWHVDDLSGRLIKHGWRYINLKAIADGTEDPIGRSDGQALWPDKRPLEWLNPKRENAYTWASLYQGEPRPRGGTLFGEPSWYDPKALPTVGYTQAHGLDLAYSAKTHADWSVCWTMLKHGDLYYVLDVKRAQVQAPEFAATLKQQAVNYPGKMRWYGSTTEVGTGQLLGSLGGLRINAKLAKGDKFVRAQPIAAAWNGGRILLPRGASWADVVIDEFGSFTGVNDRHDDLIDAAAACFDELQLKSLDLGVGGARSSRQWR